MSQTNFCQVTLSQDSVFMVDLSESHSFYFVEYLLMPLALSDDGHHGRSHVGSGGKCSSRK